MTIRQQIRVFMGAGIGLMLLALQFGKMPELLKGILIISGGWLMGIGGYFQVKLFAEKKNTQYYVVLALISIYWISLILLTIFWLAQQI